MKYSLLLCSLYFLGMTHCSSSKTGRNAKTQEPIVLSVNSKKDSALTNKNWKLIELSGKKVTVNDKENPEVHFILQSENNRVMGHGGCNSFNGSYVLSKENGISISKILSTKMACTHLEIESEFFNVLALADNFTLNGDTLVLNKTKMGPLAKFVPVELK
jgi:heat shock protein HslJ